jgi:hypothetical protein
MEKIKFNVSKQIQLLISVQCQLNKVNWDFFSKVDRTAKISKSWNSMYRCMCVYINRPITAMSCVAIAVTAFPCSTVIWTKLWRHAAHSIKKRSKPKPQETTKLCYCCATWHPFLLASQSSSRRKSFLGTSLKTTLKTAVV